MKLKFLPFAALALACLQGYIARSQDKIVTYTLSVNNIRTYNNTGGLLFNNYGFGEAGFQAPKQPIGSPNQKTSIYASTLWLGGIDPGTNIKVSAQTYRQQGNDFQPGPLEPITNAAVTDTIFNDMWRINKADVAAAKTGTITKNMGKWPVSFTTPNGKYPLAPFHDVNNDGVMDVTQGDYPIFPGDEALFFVYNDNANHDETGSASLGVEVKGFIYAFETGANEFLNNTVFVDYYITNFSTIAYTNFLAGVWTDFDLGDYSDDRIGVDTARNMYYAYNGNDNDIGVLGYGTLPPAIGVKFIDHKLYSAMGYDNSFTVIGNPAGSDNYYGYMDAIWKDNSSLTIGGNGYNTGADTKFMFGGDPCKNTGWTETSGGVAAGDRRMLGSVKINTFNTGQVHKISVAYIWSQDKNGGAINSLCKMFSQSDSLQNWLDAQPTLSTKQPANTAQVKVYPNPAIEKIIIEAATGDATAALYDLAGRQVATAQNNIITVTGLAKGLYIVRGNAGPSYFSQKILVQ